jgi:DNA-binding transcriptional regulator LsrR (DeoR family)
MPQIPLPAYKIRRLFQLCLIDNVSRNQTARRLRIARSSVRKYVEALRRSALTLSDIKHADRAELATFRRKIEVSGIEVSWLPQNKARRGERRARVGLD